MGEGLPVWRRDLSVRVMGLSVRERVYHYGGWVWTSG